MPTIDVSKYQYHDGNDYCEITMTNHNGMQVKLLNYGATLEQILLPSTDGPVNVILSLDSPADYSKERNFLGGTVGRIVGRVRHGHWRYGNYALQLPLNDGHNHIHGGYGTDTQVFSFETHFDNELATARFTLFDPDGSNGYPGNVKLIATYTLDNNNQLRYDIRAVSDKLTIFNPTNHVYFRLDGPESDVTNLTLQLNSDAYLPLDADSLPYAGRKAVDNTVFDFRKGQRLGAVLGSGDPEIEAENGLNHPFLLKGNQPAATLTSSKYHWSMSMTTKSPSVVVYTANHFNRSGIAHNIGKYDGVTLEAQFPPAEGADLTPIILMPGETFETWTTWQFNL